MQNWINLAPFFSSEKQNQTEPQSFSDTAQLLTSHLWPLKRPKHSESWAQQASHQYSAGPNSTSSFWSFHHFRRCSPAILYSRYPACTRLCHTGIYLIFLHRNTQNLTCATRGLSITVWWHQGASQVFVFVDNVLWWDSGTSHVQVVFSWFELPGVSQQL